MRIGNRLGTRLRFLSGWQVLRRPGAVFQLAATPPVRALNAGLALPGLIGASAWGAALGCYVGGVNILITSVKMPAFFVLTLGVCFALMHIVQLSAGLGLRAGQTLTVVLAGVSTTALALGCLAPVVALACLSSPYPDTASYRNLYVASALAGAVAGWFGLRNLGRGLKQLARGRPTRGVLALWLVIYQFVGAQSAWMLRPWLGSSQDFGGVYSLEHGLSGNFYVGVAQVALRWLNQHFGVNP